MAEETGETSTRPKLFLFTYSVLGPMVQVEVPDHLPIPKGQPKPDKPTPIARSREGSIHFRPGSSVELTRDEHEFLKANRPEVAKGLLFVSESESFEERVERLKRESAAVHGLGPSGSSGVASGSVSSSSSLATGDATGEDEKPGDKPARRAGSRSS